MFISHILAGAGPDLRDCFHEVQTNPASFHDVGVQQPQGASSLSTSDDGMIALRPESRSNSSDSQRSASSACSKSSGGSSRAANSLPSSGSGSVSKSSSGSNWLIKGLNKLLPSNSASSKQLQPSLSESAKASLPRAQQPQALVVRPAQHAHGCARCPENLCKGSRIRAMKQAGALPIIYAGDGSNDICAALALDARDVVLARRGFPLGNFVEAQMGLGSRGGEALRARALLWRTHEELESLVRQLVVRA